MNLKFPNKIRLILILSIMLVSFAACEAIIEIDMPEEKRRLVLNSYINDETDTVKVQLFESQHIFGRSVPFKPVSDASLFFVEEDGNRTPFTFNVSDSSFILPKSIDINKSYSIEGNHPNFVAIQAKTNVPEKVFPQGISYKKVKFESSDYYEVSVEIEDVSDASNYYGIGISVKYTDVFSYNDGFGNVYEDTIVFEDFVYPRTNDPLFSTQWAINGLFVFDDLVFNGSSYNLRLLVDAYFIDGYNEFGEQNKRIETELTVDFYHLSKDYFEYARTYESFQQSRYDPFAQLTQVYNNIENGFGIFAGFSKTKTAFAL